jgi:pimeloyl-ACP methyl ester carboxylesterase
VTILLILLVLYGLIVLAFFLLQTKLLFPGSVGGGHLPAAAERLQIETPDHVVLRGVHLPPAGAAKAGPVILGFGGNAADAEGTALLLHDLYPSADVIAFHYRGYGGSGGRPSAAGLAADAPLEYDLAGKRFPNRPIVVAGFSVGSGIAAMLASRRPVAGLMLVTPFDSLTAVAAGHYPWLPVRLLFRNRLEPAQVLKDNRVPIAIVAAGADTLVVKARTDGLRTAVPRLVFDRTIPGAGHNSIYSHPAFVPAMHEAMAAVAAAADAARPRDLPRPASLESSSGKF